ncbi:MAG: hypothetical protein WBA13_10050 [Microcoleaceae cyanobacterium]
MSVYSPTPLTQSPEVEYLRSQTSCIIQEPTETSQRIEFSTQRFVYVVHAIVIVAILAIVNGLHSTSPVSSNLELQLSQQLIDWQVTQD